MNAGALYGPRSAAHRCARATRCAASGERQRASTRDGAPQGCGAMGASLLGGTAHVRGASPCRGIKGTTMNFTQRTRGLVKTLAVVLALGFPVMLAVSTAADARVGGGGSSGPRGGRTYSAPPGTTTAPTAAQPFNRTMTQPGSP